MKKLLLLAVMAIGLSSCQKDEEFNPVYTPREDRDTLSNPTGYLDLDLQNVHWSNRASSKTYRFIEGGYRFEFTDTTEDYTILFQVDVSAGDNVINITGRKDGHTFILWNNGINFCSGPQQVPITYQFRR